VQWDKSGIPASQRSAGQTQQPGWALSLARLELAPALRDPLIQAALSW